MRYKALYSRWLELMSAPTPHWVSWMGFFFLSAMITLLMTVTFSHIPSHVVVGQIAPYDIRADRDYTVVDIDTTSRLRDEAVGRVLDVYIWDTDIGRDDSERIRAAFEQSRRKPEPSRDEFERTIGSGVTDIQWGGLLKSRFSKPIEDSIVSALLAIMHNPIVSDKTAVLAEKEKGIRLLTIAGGREEPAKRSEWSGKEMETILALEEAKKQVRQFRDITREDWLSSFVVQLIQTNFVYSVKATRDASDAAIAAIPDVTIAFREGEAIVRSGERIDPRHDMVIQEINQQKEQGKYGIKFVGYFILVSLIMWVSYFFGSRFIRRFRMQARDARFAGAMLLVTLIAVRVSMFVGTSIASSPGLNVPSGAFAYAIPVAMGAMLVRLVLNAEVALIFAVIISIFCGFFVLHDPEYTAYCLLSNIAAAAFIANVDKRASVMMAGLKTAGVNVLVVAGLLLAQSYHNPSFSIGGVDTLWYLAAAFIGGILDSVLVLFGTPFAETTFGYTTDMKLLELANLNHPLLRELIIRAPGTYHHSHLVGILAEAAAERIGANPLLARVGAYYHDIGKMRKPQYYIENAKENTNWHERVNPHMAALIISSHIKDGVEMARQHGLPQQIVDLIPQHHGTKMIGFFYEMAKKSNDPTLEKLSEDDFRYPGPKPQTQEAGILLLSDGVEASVRALKEKTPTRIQQTVDSIINRSFVESQLDECDLTLRDLTDIANAFTHILTGIYHQRIEYPKQAKELAEGDKAV